MTAQEIIGRAVNRLVAAAQPSKIILFGSHARGDARADSDIDLLVIEPDVTSTTREMARLREAVGWMGVPIDILVYSEAEVAERSGWCTSPVYWAVREGRVLYDAANG